VIRQSFSLLILAIAPVFGQAFEVQEATIAQVHDAMKAGQLTCRELVGQYLKRIQAYDRNGPAINSLILINPDAEKEAAELDRRFAQSGLTGPLHCVPTIVKDKFETKGLQTTNGALVFKRYIPNKDAFQVKRIKEAGTPHWSNPPRVIGDMNTPHGDNSQFFSPVTGFPAISVPMGYTRGGMLPIGMSIYGRPWAEATLIRLAYAYQQTTRHRHPPASTPPLR